MKKKNLLLAALALTALAGCSDDTFVGDQSLQGSIGTNGAISFNMKTPAITRADKEGSAAAGDLGNRFIIYGEKGDITNVAPTAGNFVFPNYQVNWVNSSANTTSSNSKGWEYVGYTHSENYQNNITRDPSSAADDEVKASNSAQTIKYWDYNANNYIFTAVSADDDDIDKGRVKIQKNEYGATAYDKGYTITLAKSGDAESYSYPTLNKLYFSDRNVIAKSEGTDRNATNAYGGNVTMKFRNLMSHIRVGVYETISGYDISEIKFYVDNGSGEQTTLAQVSSTNAFGAVCPNIETTNYTGILTVTYNGSGAAENQPKVTANGTVNTNLILGTNMSTLNKDAATPVLLGTTATSPTWDKIDGSGNSVFTEVLPQINNSKELTLKCDYQLWNSITGETINITGKTANVPAQFLQWKSNYKYTYLFKITDGDLYPITFDAVEIIAEDGQAEYITTVTQPSVTTFGVILDNENKFKNIVTGKEDYQIPGSTDKLDIYATFMNGSTLLTLTTDIGKANEVNVYFAKYKDGATAEEKAEKPITELSVASALATDVSGLIVVSKINDDKTEYFTELPSLVKDVPAEDGTTKVLDSDNYKALKLEGIKTSGKYAVEIITYEEVKGLTVGTSLVEDYYTLSSDLYTKCAENAKAAESTTYYKQIKTYKVITVEAAP